MNLNQKRGLEDSLKSWVGEALERGQEKPVARLCLWGGGLGDRAASTRDGQWTWTEVDRLQGD